VRLAVYTDYDYRTDGTTIFAERAFVLFLGAVARSLEHVVLLGRLSPTAGTWHYPVDERIEFVPLPYYASLSHPAGVARALARSARAFWKALDGVDGAFLLGPHPFALLFAALAALRRKRVALGVRQDLPRYTAARHPGRRSIRVAAQLLEVSYRLLARRCATVVVGPELARNYRHAHRLLPISVSLVQERDIVPAARAGPSYEGELRVLSVGRLEPEKNPLLLADVVALLNDGERPRWRLTVCGQGPLEGGLRARLEELGVADMAELRGYVPIDGGLQELYRASHAFLHVSWTEGLPQVLLESFAAGLPIVATDVGGVRDAVGDAALVVPPGDAEAAANELRRIAADEPLRRRLVEEGRARVRRRTLEAESKRVADFLAAQVGA
jgi:glycosyltransferase involved in cell wall biosynthesis